MSSQGKSRTALILIGFSSFWRFAPGSIFAERLTFTKGLLNCQPSLSNSVPKSLRKAGSATFSSHCWSMNLRMKRIFSLKPRQTWSSAVPQAVRLKSVTTRPSER